VKGWIFPLNTGRKGYPDFKASRPKNSWTGQEKARIFEISSLSGSKLGNQIGGPLKRKGDFEIFIPKPGPPPVFPIDVGPE